MDACTQPALASPLKYEVMFIVTLVLWRYFCSVLDCSFGFQASLPMLGFKSRPGSLACTASAYALIVDVAGYYPSSSPGSSVLLWKQDLTPIRLLNRCLFVYSYSTAYC